MNSQVFYRKWRPKRLDEVVGQEPVVQTLRQAVIQGRIAHAYLFCGPRGTGKTSTARLLAKAVNCLDVLEGEPCNSCSMCQAINEGKALGIIIEIDAASHRGIDDIRALQEKVFISQSARYRVYIIDEVHMLTEPAFNALLKTLEEPPPYKIFVLATTEPQKVPLTVISRCQRFDFRRIPLDAIVGRLERLCLEEGIKVEAEALRAIARAAGGSLRDAENILEQLAVSYGSPLSLAQARSLLGIGDDEKALELVTYIMKGQIKEGLILINQVASEGKDLRQLHRGAVEHLRAALLLKAGITESMGYTSDTVATLESLVRGTSMERILQSVKTFGQVNLRQDSASPLPLELALLEATSDLQSRYVEDAPSDRKMVGLEKKSEVGPIPRREGTPLDIPKKRVGIEKTPSSSDSPLRSASNDSSVEEPSVRAPVYPEAVMPSRQALSHDSVPLKEGASNLTGVSDAQAQLEKQWDSLVKSLSRYKGKRFFLGALLKDCKAREINLDRLTLKFGYRSHKERMEEELSDPQTRRVFEESILKTVGTSYKVNLALTDDASNGPTKPSAQSHMVRAALAMGARIIEDEREQT